MDHSADSVAPQRRPEQIASILENKIQAGKLQEGSRLPDEADLAREYGVDSRTVERALALLQEQGLLITVPGRGFFVRAHAQPG